MIESAHRAQLHSGFRPPHRRAYPNTQHALRCLRRRLCGRPRQGPCRARPRNTRARSRVRPPHSVRSAPRTRTRGASQTMTRRGPEPRSRIRRIRAPRSPSRIAGEGGRGGADGRPGETRSRPRGEQTDPPRPFDAPGRLSARGATARAPMHGPGKRSTRLRTHYAKPARAYLLNT